MAACLWMVSEKKTVHDFMQDPWYECSGKVKFPVI